MAAVSTNQTLDALMIQTDMSFSDYVCSSRDVLSVSNCPAASTELGAVTAVTPRSGIQTGGDLVTIRGWNMYDARDLPSVTLAGVATILIRNTSSSIVVQTIASSGALSTEDVVVSSATRGVMRLRNQFAFMCPAGGATLQTVAIDQRSPVAAVRAQQTVLSATASYIACTDAPQVLYEWTQSAGPAVLSDSVTSRLLALPKLSMAFGSTYIFAVRAWSAGQLLSVSSNVTVTIAPTMFSASIDGGTRSVLSSALPLTLVANVYDADKGPTPTCVWSCTGASAICSASLGSGCSIQIATLSTGSHLFTVNVASGTRSTSASATVVVAAASGVATAGLTYLGPSTVSLPMAVQGWVTPDVSVTYTWTMSPVVDLTNTSLVSSVPNSAALVIAAGLTPGVSYTLTLRAANVAGYTTAAMAFSVAPLPRLGVCVLSVESAYPLQQFSISCSGFTTSYSPVRYVAFQVNADGSETALSGLSAFGTIVVSLAASAVLQANSTAFIAVYAVDGSGQSVRATTSVVLMPLAASSAAEYVSTTLRNVLQPAVQSADVFRVGVASLAVMATLQGAQNESALQQAYQRAQGNITSGLLTLAQNANVTVFVPQTCDLFAEMLLSVVTSPVPMSDSIVAEVRIVLSAVSQAMASVGGLTRTPALLALISSRLDSSSNSANVTVAQSWIAVEQLQNAQLQTLQCGQSPASLSVGSVRGYVAKAPLQVSGTYSMSMSGDGQVVLPREVFTSANQTATGGGCLAVRTLVSAVNPYTWTGGSPVSSVVRVSVMNSDGTVGVAVSGLQSPVQLSVYSNLPRRLAANQTVGCRYWDTISSAWSLSGCNSTYNAVTNLTMCSCNHLTDFALFVEPFVPTVLIVHMQLIGFTIAVIGAYLLGLMVIWCAERKERLRLQPLIEKRSQALIKVATERRKSLVEARRASIVSASQGSPARASLSSVQLLRTAPLKPTMKSIGIQANADEITDLATISAMSAHVVAIPVRDSPAAYIPSRSETPEPKSPELVRTPSRRPSSNVVSPAPTPDSSTSAPVSPEGTVKVHEFTPSPRDMPPLRRPSSAFDRRRASMVKQQRPGTAMDHVRRQSMVSAGTSPPPPVGRTMTATGERKASLAWEEPSPPASPNDESEAFFKHTTDSAEDARVSISNAGEIVEPAMKRVNSSASVGGESRKSSESSRSDVDIGPSPVVTVWRAVIRFHSWFAVLAKSQRYSRVQRLTTWVLSVFGNLCVCAVMYAMQSFASVGNGPAIQMFIIACFGTVSEMLLSVIMRAVMHSSRVSPLTYDIGLSRPPGGCLPHFTIYVWYTVALMLSVCCAITVCLLSALLSASQAQYWLSSVCIAAGVDIVLLQTAVVAISFAVVPREKPAVPVHVGLA
eukprot:TRINITY_DN5108_c0_g3_i1.p1 TRINITY_DN5108_c0_g3~~TRINITY_DN5108_c0_g3_i1.p1  ORF type:complete len:1422 (+),score=347.65 TRINITY_DN5108_c0_g3_i1:148-4266(+)